MIQVNRVIVTVRDPIRQTELDLEMPAFVPIGRLRGELLETLHTLRPQQWLSVSAIELLDGDRVLADSETLSSLGLWDGSILTVRPAKEGTL